MAEARDRAVNKKKAKFSPAAYWERPCGGEVQIEALAQETSERRAGESSVDLPSPEQSSSKREAYNKLETQKGGRQGHEMCSFVNCSHGGAFAQTATSV